MIQNYNVTKEAPTGEYVDVKKFIGVGTVNIVAVNPDNAKLRQFGWNLAEDAKEPQYVTKDESGKIVASRVRFLAQIQELENKPTVALDFWVRPGFHLNNDETKCKIIDGFGRTAWATKDDVKRHSVPQYENGPADISKNYLPCHRGEEELVCFLMKYLNVTPFQKFVRKNKDSNEGEWVPTENPGVLTIDDWNALCTGNAKELADYVALQPDNRIKLTFGVRTKEDNKSYQVFLMGGHRDYAYISNAERVDAATGEFRTARKGIDRFLNGKQTAAQYEFSAGPIREWKLEADSVSDNSAENIFSNGSSDNEENDLPF